MIRALIPYILSAAAAFAAAYDVNLPYASLALKNGKTLTGATIKSYDHDNGKVVVMAGRSLHSLQIELLPDEVAAKVIALVPEERKALAREEKAGRKQEQREQVKTRQELKRQTREERTLDTEAKKQANRDQAEAQAKARLVARTKQLAHAKADHYFRYEYKPGSGSTVVIRQGVTLGEPEEVSGWPGRCRVSGNVGLQFYDSRGSSFSTTVREFEVTVQKNDRGVEEVVDFTLK
jgi:hypothetical protein